MNFLQIKSKLLGGGEGVFKGMATLALGASFARLVGFLSIPILTRIYSPEDFGVLAIFISLVAITTPLLTLRYALAIPLPVRDESALNVLFLSLVLIVSISFLVAMALLFWGGDILRFFSVQQIVPYKWLILLGVIGAALYELFSMWGTRKRTYKIIAQTAALQGLCGNFTKIVLGLMMLQPVGLLIGHVVTVGGGIANLIRRFHLDFRMLSKKISISRVLIVAEKYKHFPVYRLPSQILLACSFQAPALFSGVLYGVENTGQLGLAMMVLSVPVGLIGQAVGQAFYGEIAQLKRGAELRIKELSYLVQKRLLLIGAPPTIAIYLLSEPVFRLLFGERWSLAGQYASVLAPFLLMQLTSAPLVQVLNVFDSQKSFLIMNIVRIFGLLLIFLTCSFFNLAMGSYVELLAVFLFCFYLFISLYILVFLNVQAKVAAARQ